MGEKDVVCDAAHGGFADEARDAADGERLAHAVQHAILGAFDVDLDEIDLIHPDVLDPLVEPLGLDVHGVAVGRAQTLRCRCLIRDHGRQSAQYRRDVKRRPAVGVAHGEC